MTSPPRLLEPIERVSEVLFGLIMVLTFTGSLSAAEAGREDIQTMLYGALGCNVAWGIIDAVLYLMASLSERGRGLRVLRAVRDAADPRQGGQIVAAALPPVLAAVLSEAELGSMHGRLRALPEPPRQKLLTRDDWLGAVAVFLWVFLSTFPVTIPFLFMADATRALRVSNGIAIALLFLTGYSFGHLAGLRPLRTGIVMVVLGSVLVGITIALGG